MGRISAPPGYYWDPNSARRGRKMLRKLPSKFISKDKWDIDTEVYNKTITQMRVSSSVSFFKDNLLKKYNLIDYNDENKPCIFNGMYSKEDYSSLINHKSHKTIVWCGTDIQKYFPKYKNYLIKAGKVRHIAKSNFISKTLKNYNIPHITLPITPTIPVKNYKPKGDNIYFYSSNTERGRIKYGYKILERIKNLKPEYNFIETTPKLFSKSDLEKIYESCFLGLRLTEHDGLSNTVLELGLMGRNCIHNGNTPNSLNYNNINDIIDLIDKQFEERHNNSCDITDKVYDFININNDWLNV